MKRASPGVRKSASIAKITQPALPAHYPRTRLFRLLDTAGKRPIVWISAPPGAGKTTLVGSYVESRRLPCLWYKVDEGDADPATFFYYLGLAARRSTPRNKRPLPLLTPEYLPGLPVFTRRFFQELYGRMKPGSVLVFDDCHAAPPDSPLHEAIRGGLAELPDGLRAILLSRSHPPPAFARKRANQSMKVVGWNEIRLTPEETEGIARLRWKGKLPGESVRYLQSRTDGWAAGLTLLLERSELAGVEAQRLGRRAPEEIFDYFAGEVFGDLDPGTREVLLKSAFFPRMTAAMAQRLTGRDDAGRILSDMSRHNRFTAVLPDDEPVYECHALFREFLLARAKAAFPAGQISRLQREAAALLAERGQVEDAVGLLRECGDRAELCRVVLSHAPVLAAQGRFRTLEEWLRSFPRSVLEEIPWLRYWSGVSCMPFRPHDSRAQFEKAFEKFRKRKDAAGVLLSWSGVVDSCYFGFDGFRALSPWIAALHEALGSFGDFPSKEIEERVTASMMRALGLTVGEPSHVDERSWEKRAFAVARTSASISMRIDVLLGLFWYLIGKDFRKTHLVVDMMRELARRADVPPLSVLCARWYMAAHAIFEGAHDRCMEAVNDGLRLAESTGIRLVDCMLIGQGALSAMITGNLGAAKDLLRRMAAVGEIHSGYAGGFFQYLAAWEALGDGDPARARLHSEQHIKICEEVGYRWSMSVAYLQAAFVAFESGSPDQADEHLRTARRVVAGGGDVIEFHCALAEAYFLLRKGNEGAALERLRAGLAAGRSAGFGGVYAWCPGFMERIAAKALEAGIESEYVRELIRKNALVPDESLLGLEQWPWPVRIRALGGFEILRDDKPIEVSRKAKQKPLAMLKLLLALGGREVPEEKITDALWPEAEGDLSHQSFTTTLRRLRALLGDERALVLWEGRLSLDHRRCWTDVRALDRLIAEADRETERSPHDAARLKGRIARILDLYKGPFLSGDGTHPAVVGFRERLRARFLRCVADGGSHLERAGEWEAALSCYRKGLEVDDLAEEFYRGLMGCYARLGRTAEAVSVYRRCREALSFHLGVRPSRRTEALYRSLVPGPE